MASVGFCPTGMERGHEVSEAHRPIVVLRERRRRGLSRCRPGFGSTGAAFGRHADESCERQRSTVLTPLDS